MTGPREQQALGGDTADFVGGGGGEQECAGRNDKGMVSERQSGGGDSVECGGTAGGGESAGR